MQIRCKLFLIINNVNNDTCRCECKELTDKGVRNKGYIWNSSNCKCECDKSCDVGEYLDYCWRISRLFYKLTEEGTDNIDEVKIASESTLELLLILFTANT